MAKLVWDEVGERFWETGCSHGVLYVQDSDRSSETFGKYPVGVAWNGLTAVTESPGGAEANDMYADDIKYASIRSAETFGATIEAYTYPDEFLACDGGVEAVPGLIIGQQSRNPFGFSFKTKIGNDTVSEGDDGYKLHLIYNATASPSERGYQTINESPEAITFSWEVTTTPVPVTGRKPTASLTINSLKWASTTRPSGETLSPAEKLALLEDVLYGDATYGATLPTPDEVIYILTNGTVPTSLVRPTA